MFVTKYTKLFLGIASVFVASSVVILVFLGIPFGIDFTGGALTEIVYSEAPEKQNIENSLEELNLGEYSLRATTNDEGKKGFILRTRDVTEFERQSIETVLTEKGSEAELVRFASIGPVIGEELKDKAVWAIGAMVLVIILYVAFAFRNVSRPVGSWVYGGITILALVHDILIPTAVFSIFGYITGAEAGVLFIMALLAVLGYSVNDTIVVFDRVRENLLHNKKEGKTENFTEVVGKSVSQTMTRSINTSLTTLFVLSALYIFGGEVTKDFALILIAGVIAGTYSSICIANPLLILVGAKKTKST